ncbi:MAG: penicillin-binding protein 2 [Candidatus Staskawiczbacteria bacterium RIFOXYD1_FULL_39_28]|uniref:Penicillin-binding protein 2 n=1 Tax=Candidatus Staskawiczbacteria bacterium RIFOXYC1_FULL_38_18 TaxID=1802229 RepID=A0A1G2JBA6_9BACT|nr:MAG: penicillin-binding protein 2 [Candidatus Staskawiczbacteria bacterium RIFOXYC1_FULL_38_18]OGZ90619.1 MAG: penicillin-binding protein 2 [Candidatus Staskawiczbacteria bacterium RIFOXYD1_FULL_39_28]
MFKQYKVKNSNFDIEPHEVFLDKLAHEKEEEFGLSEIKFEVAIKAKMAYLILGVFLIVATGLFAKVFYFQAVNGEKLQTQAENNRGAVNIIMPDRGIIYDKNMKQLVTNSPAYDLVCSRARFSASSEEISAEIRNIAEIIAVNPDDLANKIQSESSSQVLVAENISQQNLLVLEARIGDFEECKILQNTFRGYAHGPVFSQILGYTGRINADEYSGLAGYSINGYIGKTGLEKHYEAYLRGTPGQSRPKGARLTSSKGEVVKPEILLAPIAGNNLVLNVDAELQSRIYNALEERLKDIGAKKGAAVAMDPRTGAVLALVSYPSYDDNLFSGGISQDNYNKIINDPSQPFFNRAISAKYPTGSTIKPFEAAAALQEKIISPDKKINDIGYILVPSQYDPSVVYRYGGVTPHGWVDMKEAIAVSSNIYFYTIGGGYGDQQGLGPTRIKKYLSLFGWDQKTGIDLPGEFSGFIPDPAWKKSAKGASWTDGDTYNLSIGQSDLQTTPLQVAMAYSAIANGGILYKPQIVNKIVANTGNSQETIQQYNPEVIRSNFIDKENLDIVRQGMRDGVTESYGLSRSLNNLPVSVAAKTGTAEIGYQTKFNLWSAVFAPYENPEIVLVVTAEEVQALGAVTLPVAHDVLQWYFDEKSR